MCLFLDKGENWTKAGIPSTSSSCRAEPLKTSRSCSAGGSRASMGFHPSFLHSSRGQSDTQARLRENVPKGIPVAVPSSVLCRSQTGSSPSSSMAVVRPEPPLIPTRPGAEESPLEPSGTRKEAGRPILQPRPPYLVSLWFTLVSSPSLDSGCGSGEVVLETGTVGN